MTGRTHELKVDKTTIGRMDDNTFQIAEPSVSSHHCEVLLRGSDVVVRDLNSTNGTYINGQKVTESPIKPGQILRLGQIELRLETDAAGVPGAPPGAAAAPAPALPGPAKKPADQTLAMTRGVTLNELEQGSRAGGFDTASKGFSKKDDKASKFFWILAAIFGAVIALLLIYVFASL